MFGNVSPVKAQLPSHVLPSAHNARYRFAIRRTRERIVFANARIGIAILVRHLTARRVFNAKRRPALLRTKDSSKTTASRITIIIIIIIDDRAQRGTSDTSIARRYSWRTNSDELQQAITKATRMLCRASDEKKGGVLFAPIRDYRYLFHNAKVSEVTRHAARTVAHVRAIANIASRA